MLQSDLHDIGYFMFFYFINSIHYPRRRWGHVYMVTACKADVELYV